MRFIPKRIEEVGLKKWLDDSKDEHHNHGYDRFIDMLESELNYTVTQIAIEFGVTRETIYKWKSVRDEEEVRR